MEVVPASIERSVAIVDYETAEDKKKAQPAEDWKGDKLPSSEREESKRE